jgi:hypothetical protein
MPGITVKLTDKEKRTFAEIVQNRSLSLTSVFRMLVVKMINDPDTTLDFLFFDEKKGR